MNSLLKNLRAWSDDRLALEVSDIDRQRLILLYGRVLGPGEARVATEARRASISGNEAAVEATVELSEEVAEHKRRRRLSSCFY